MQFPAAPHCWWLVAIGLIVAQPASAGADETFKQALSELATREGRRLMEGQELSLDVAPFRGTLAAVNMKDNFRATVSEFTLANDQVRARVILAGSFQIAGSIRTDGGGTLPLSARLKLSLTVTGSVAIDFQDRDLVLKPRVTDLDARILKVEGVKPDNLAGWETVIARLLNNGNC